MLLDDILLEKLKLRQAREYTWTSKLSGKHEEQDKFFDGKEKRRTFDVPFSVKKNREDIYDYLSHDPSDFDLIPVERNLAEIYEEFGYGYRYFDFSKGTCSTDKKNWIKFNTLLRKAKKDGKVSDDGEENVKRYLKMYNDFKSKLGEFKKKANYEIEYSAVLSRGAIDIAGMSTDRGWDSCMDLDGNQMHKMYVKKDVEHGTLIAYLIKKKDTNLQEPLGRVLIKPYIAGKRQENERGQIELGQEEYFEMMNEITDELFYEMFNEMLKGNESKWEYKNGKSVQIYFRDWYEENKSEIMNIIYTYLGYPEQQQYYLMPPTRTIGKYDHEKGEWTEKEKKIGSETIQTLASKKEREEMYEYVFDEIELRGTEVSNKTKEGKAALAIIDMYRESEGVEEGIRDGCSETANERMQQQGFAIGDDYSGSDDLDYDDVYFQVGKLYFDKDADLDYRLLDKFRDVVKDFIKSKQKDKVGMYSLHPRLYDDGDGTVIEVHKGTSSPHSS